MVKTEIFEISKLNESLKQANDYLGIKINVVD